MMKLLGEGYLRFTFDFAKAPFMCSAGLGLLVEIHNAAARGGGTVAVENLNPQLEKLLTDTKLMSVFSTPDAPVQERMEALQAVQKHMSQELLFLTYLNTISSSVLRADITSEVHQTTLEGVVRSLKSPEGMLLLIDEGETGQVLRVAASEGFSPEANAKAEGLALDDGTFERDCLDQTEARLFSASNNTPDRPSPLLEALGVDEGILAPIVGRKNALGLVVVSAAEDASSFFPHSIPLLQVFSNVCGLAIEKQSMLEDIQYKNSQLAKTLNKLNKTQDSLMEAGKLAVIGSMMRGLAHALNNKLVPIMGYAQILAAQVKSDVDLSEKVGIVETAAMDIKRIVDNLRAMVVRKELNVETHDIREVVDSALFILDYAFKEHRIRVQRDFGDLDGSVQIDRERIIQAFLALFHRLPPAFAEQSDRLLTIGLERDDTHLAVRLTDNGHSIPKEEMRTILNPFNGFDGPFANDRLNFSIANGVVKDHRGTLEVISNETGGISTILRMPLIQKPRHSQLIG